MKRNEKEIATNRWTIERNMKEDSIYEYYVLKIRHFFHATINVPLSHRQTAVLSTTLCGASWRESDVNYRPYNIKEALKTDIMDAISIMDKDAIAKACSRF